VPATRNTAGKSVNSPPSLMISYVLSAGVRGAKLAKDSKGT
jgi:hypothetical protein